MPIPAKVSSLRSLLVAINDKGTGAPTGFYPFNSVKAGTTDYQFRIGSQIIAPKPPSTNCELFS